MLKLQAMNVTLETVKEVNLIPELTTAKAKTTDPHGD
jgi:hypothetical protein